MDESKPLLPDGENGALLCPACDGQLRLMDDSAQNGMNPPWYSYVCGMCNWALGWARTPELARITLERKLADIAWREQATREKKAAAPPPIALPADVVDALRASQQCISDFLGVYRNGGSMLIMDLAVNSLKNDALSKVDKVLQRINEETNRE